MLPKYAAICVAALMLSDVAYATQADITYNHQNFKDTPEDYAKLGTLGSNIRKTNAENTKTDAEQALLARKVFAKHVSRGDRKNASGALIPAGCLDIRGYVTAAVDAELSPEYMRDALAWNTTVSISCTPSRSDSGR